MEKIRFIRKIKYSITNISKYDDMISLGLKKAINYFIGLLALLALALGVFETYIQAVYIADFRNYLNQEIPEFSIVKNVNDENYSLSMKENEAIILEDQQLIDLYKNKIVINTNLNEQEAINEYYTLVSENNNCIIILKDEYVQITSAYNPENNDGENQEGINKYTFEELFNTYGISGKNEYTKQDLINIFDNISYTYYVVAFFAKYLIILIIFYTMDILVIGIIAIICSKILKQKNTVKEIFSLSIYSLTLPAILFVAYLILSYIKKINIPYINFINIIIAYIYMAIWLYKKNKKTVAQE